MAISTRIHHLMALLAPIQHQSLRGIRQSLGMAQRFLQQEGTEIRHRSSLLLRAMEQGLMHVKTEDDRDATRLALEQTQSVVHGRQCDGGDGNRFVNQKINEPDSWKHEIRLWSLHDS
jgi:hypothetical protein